MNVAHHKIASRYAKSFLSVAVDKKEETSVFNDMLIIIQTMNASKIFSTLLKSPIIKSDKKLAIINKVFPEISQVSRCFISILIRKKRESLLQNIAKSFTQQYKKYKDILEAHLVSVNEFSKKNLSMIKEIIEQQYPDKKVEITQTFNPDLIGGFLLTIGNYSFNSSIRKQILELKKQVKNNHFQKNINT